ncbi:hypothetical protein TNCT_150241 [Trichonephila clavata]|uniref:Uncharacterized protein n=1 Tax=Trichonephila clavata TaxID=2740835 RepID=A0A8X6FSD3_TRICU|nr:hypothetical protein TNCT_150241 [Trichonephila clavata]
MPRRHCGLHCAEWHARSCFCPTKHARVFTALCFLLDLRTLVAPYVTRTHGLFEDDLRNAQSTQAVLLAPGKLFDSIILEYCVPSRRGASATVRFTRTRKARFFSSSPVPGCPS